MYRWISLSLLVSACSLATPLSAADNLLGPPVVTEDVLPLGKIDQVSEGLHESQGSSMPASGARTLSITAAQWARPRSGKSLTQLPALNKFVRQFNNEQHDRIMIWYADGDTGSLWAEEMRAWLVALGVPSHCIQLRIGAQVNDAIILETTTMEKTDVE